MMKNLLRCLHSKKTNKIRILMKIERARDLHLTLNNISSHSWDHLLGLNSKIVWAD
jgi:hypothetical protein